MRSIRKHSRGSDQRGFTIMELLAVIAIIGVLAGLLLPAIQASRETVRRCSCASNLAQVGLAVVGYHSAYQQFPVPLSGTDGNVIAGQDNDRRLSVLVALLPFLSKTAMVDSIRDPHEKSLSDDPSFSPDQPFFPPGEHWVIGGPEPFCRHYSPWECDVTALRCPSDPGVGFPSMGRTNYAVSLGDGIVGSVTGPMTEVNGRWIFDASRAKETEVSMRGLFMPRRVTRFDHVVDGLSSTIMLAEIATGLRDEDVRTHPAVASQMPAPNTLRDRPDRVTLHHWNDESRPLFWKRSSLRGAVNQDSSARRGYRWADGIPLFSGFNTILPPNGPIILSLDQVNSDGVMPPSSRHHGGIQACMADGAVRFITDSVDVGQSSAKTVYLGSYPESHPASPYGVWGAMGTRASGELKGFSGL